jgi:hypothetical protein
MIALYPGAFKPPHRGHFEVVKSLLNNTHGGKTYNIDNYSDAGLSALSGDKDNLKGIDKVLVFIGKGNRNGISKEESMAVWKIYAKYLPGLEIIDGENNPMITAKDYAKKNKDSKFYAITGIRGEEDLVDLKRVTTFKNRDNVEGLVIPSGKQSNVRATDFRKALLSGNLDSVLDFFPKELSKEEILNIINMLKSSIIAEEMQQDLNDKLDHIFESDSIKEGSSGTHIGRGVMRSDEKAKLIDFFQALLPMVDQEEYLVTFNQDHIRIQIKQEDQKIGHDYTPFMPPIIEENKKEITENIASILEYMLKEKINISPLPEVKVKYDEDNAKNFFGRTAYYDPTKKEVVLYVIGRHPKDVCRSFTHEMIHHKQNLEGRLENIGTTDTNKDEYLQEIEKEAYLEGNITFRNWEDSVKKVG